MKFLSLFSGIEAVSMAWKPLGFECAAFAEIDPFPCAVLNARWPSVPNLGDVTKITKEQVDDLGKIDITVGGFPCQDLSVAGQRKGLKNADGTDTRSGLFFDFLRIADWSGSRWTLAENVPGLFSSNGGLDFATVVGGLAGCEIRVPGGGWKNAGMALGPKGLVEWCVLDAQYFGLAQRRKRIFIVRDSSGQWFDRPPLLLERTSLRWDPAPRREAGKRVAPTVEGRAGRSGANSFATSGGLYETAPTLSARTKGGGGLGTDADLDGALIAHCLNGHAGPHGRLDGESETFVPVTVGPLTACGGTEKKHGYGPGQQEIESGQVVDFQPRFYTRDNKTGGAAQITTGSLTRGKRNGDSQEHCFYGYAVRRLLPVECEILMGFPRNYTAIQYRGKPACDGPRYKAIGNSMAVPVLKWIGQRIEAVETVRRSNVK